MLQAHKPVRRGLWEISVLNQISLLTKSAEYVIFMSERYHREVKSMVQFEWKTWCTHLPDSYLAVNLDMSITLLRHCEWWELHHKLKILSAQVCECWTMCTVVFLSGQWNPLCSLLMGHFLFYSQSSCMCQFFFTRSYSLLSNFHKSQVVLVFSHCESQHSY